MEDKNLNNINNNQSIWSTSTVNIGKEIGRGSFGVVCGVVHKETGRRAALKSLNKSLLNEEYINNEIEIMKNASSLNHPNIVILFGVEQTPTNTNIYMERCTETLGDLIANFRDSKPSTKSVMRQMFAGVDALHISGIFHRDLKPTNVLIDQNGLVKIADFGLARKYIVEDVEVQFSQLLGSKCYAPPEAFTNLLWSGPAYDVWSCGISMFEYSTGKVLWALPLKGDERYDSFYSNNLNNEMWEGVWNEMEKSEKAFLLQCLDVDPEKRISTSSALRHAFLKKRKESAKSRKRSTAHDEDLDVAPPSKRA